MYVLVRSNIGVDQNVPKWIRKSTFSRKPLKAEYHRKQMEMFEAAAEQFPDF